MIPLISDVGAYLKAQHAAYLIDIVAGSGTDNKEVTTATVDRLGFGSGFLLISYNATLAEGKTISFTIKEQQSDDDSSYDTAVTVQTATVASTGDTGGSTETGYIKLDADFSGKKRYLQYLITADLNATGTDTADWHALNVIGGADSLPIS